jgi:hypothetical protein
MKHMKAYGHLKPGQKGTQRLVAEFGETLVCVRYRYDERTGDNVTTAEIIVDRRSRMKPLFLDADLVAVAVAYDEKALREKLKAAGGRWDPEEKFWKVRFGSIRRDHALVGRIVTDTAAKREPEPDRLPIHRESDLYK